MSKIETVCNLQIVPSIKITAVKLLPRMALDNFSDDFQLQ